MYISFPVHRYFILIRRLLLTGIFCFILSGVHAQAYDTVETNNNDDYVTDKETGYTDDQENEYFRKLTAYDSFHVQARTVPDSVLKQFREDRSFWYTRTDVQKGERTTQPRRQVQNGRQVERQPRESVTTEPYTPVSGQTWFQTLMWIIIIGGFAGAIIWYLANNNVGLFRKKEKKLVNPDEEGDIPENIFAINYQQEIDKAAAQGNYRLAIRLMYLRLLRNLSERNIIQYKQDKTNFDYLMQLQSTSYYRDFFRVTRHYEYSWYGEFNVSPDAYSIIRHEFDHFEKTSG